MSEVYTALATTTVLIGDSPSGNPDFFGQVVEIDSMSALVSCIISDGEYQLVSVPRATMSIRVMGSGGSRHTLFHHLTNKGSHLNTLKDPTVITKLAKKTGLLDDREMMEAVLIADVLDVVTLALLNAITDPDLRFWVLTDPSVDDLAADMRGIASKQEVCDAAIKLYEQLDGELIGRPPIYKTLLACLRTVVEDQDEMVRFIETVVDFQDSEIIHNAVVRGMDENLALRCYTCLQASGSSLQTRLLILEHHLPTMEITSHEALAVFLTDDAPIEVIIAAAEKMNHQVSYLIVLDKQSTSIMRMAALWRLSKFENHPEFLVAAHKKMSPELLQEAFATVETHANSGVFADVIATLKIMSEAQASDPPSA
ncbi:hypothetical protein HOI18_01585 [Candidatus Uhrbacteria bacterium]|jgi:hypothetical protein|nr:hypothetical protein [Candidatus Uhrbacteria bacterium]